MNTAAIKKVVIVGGGTAGWMTAAALSRFFPPEIMAIELVESEQIGTVGVGEATIPHIRQFNAMLGVDENEFIQRTQATYKLGIQFSDWGRLGDRYIHPFGFFGHDISGVEFHHYWLRLKAQGDDVPLEQFAVAAMAALQGKFAYPVEDPENPLSEYAYAFHLDASLYAQFLREYACRRGVRRTEGKISDVQLSPDSGFVETLLLDDGARISGDLFIDCSGFRGLLIERALQTGYEDWRHWLPCDRAVALPADNPDLPLPYTRAVARSAGWQWSIPLQHRTGNGLVYASDSMSDSEAAQTLMQNLPGKALAEPNFLRFVAGRRKKSWNKNCVAIGLSSGFLEPLESTSIYLIQQGILKLLEFFPDKSFAPVNTREFNRQLQTEYERVRDFIILHYKATERDDSGFWRYCRTMSIPDSLRDRIELFRESAQISVYEKGLFKTPSWLAVLTGQGIVPRVYDRRIDAFSTVAELRKYLYAHRDTVARVVAGMEEHQQALAAIGSSPRRYPAAGLSLYGARSP